MMAIAPIHCYIHNTQNVKSFMRHKRCNNLFPLAISQKPVYTTRPQIQGHVHIVPWA